MQLLRRNHVKLNMKAAKLNHTWGDRIVNKMMIVITLILLLSGCDSAVTNNGNSSGTGNTNTNTNTNTGQNQNADAPLPTPAETDTSTDDKPTAAATEQEAADAVILALKNEDLTTLADYIHPVKGLLFSPYAHIDTATAKVFPAASLPALTDPTVYNWGFYDGSGEPIDLTFQQYYDKFVYDQDFMNPETIGVDVIKGLGNTIVNIEDVFPNSYVMDYHFSGFDAQYDGMDWESLILVLEELNGAWYVSAVLHSQWTI